MRTKQKMLRFLVPLEDARKLEKEAKELSLSVSSFIGLLIKQWSDGMKIRWSPEGNQN